MAINSATRHSSLSIGLVRWLLPLASVVAGSLLVGSVRAGLAEGFHEQVSAETESLLLPPEYTAILSLGHREALADYLYATARVDYGQSFIEKRAYKRAYQALDTMTFLAPTFAAPYLFADTFLTLQAVAPPMQNYRDVFSLHDRGTQALPYHTELWFVAGQYAAYIAPQHLPKSELRQIKLRGARLMSRACELADSNKNIPYHCLNAARMFNRGGQRDALIRMLTRTLAVNDDPEIREKALLILRRTMGERERDRQERRLKAVESEWKKSTGFVSRTMISLLGPSANVWNCVGAEASERPGCVSSWRAWSDSRWSEADK